jgi:aquaporin Z
MVGEPSPTAKYVAEFLGTFFLVFTMGCNIHTGNIGAALSVGAVLMAMVYALGSVSGAHFNPAVTLAVHLSSRGKISPRTALCYMAVQLAGGMAGTLVFWRVIGGPVLMHAPSVHYSTHEAEAAEFLYTLALCYVVLNVTASQKTENGDPPGAYSGLAIGFTVAGAGIAAGPISGCSLNPAATVGSMAMARFIQGPLPFPHFLSLYTFAPFMGAVAGAFAFQLVRGKLSDVDDDARSKLMLKESMPNFPVTGPIGSPQSSRNPTARVGARIDEMLGPPPSAIRLRVNEPVALPTGVAEHDMYCQLRWQMRKAAKGRMETVDLDLSCVKFSAAGTCLGGVYFAEQADVDNCIVHTGDQITGASKGADSEAITFRLSDLKSNVHALFFVAMIYSAEATFKGVQQCAIRMVDMTMSNKEFCRYDKADMESEANALIAAMVYRSGNGWCCKAVDESYVLPPLSTFRKLEPQMAELCLQTVPGSRAGSFGTISRGPSNQAMA